MGYSQGKLATLTGLSPGYIANLEKEIRVNPSREIMKKIAKELKKTVNEVFFYDDEVVETVSIDEPLEDKSITKSICNYMSAMSGERNYNVYEVSVIRKSIRLESIRRGFRAELMGKKIDGRTKIGKKIINKCIADIANETLKDRKISVRDVEIYKRCQIFEYENRTSKCSWGIPSARQALGFDPKTGEEIS